MENQSRTQNSIFNLVTGISGQLLSTLLKFVSRTVFIYILGKQYLGINSLFSDILQMLNLTELGFDTALNFKLYKPLADKNMKRIRLLMKFYCQAYMLVGTTVLILGLGIIPLLPRLIRDYNHLQTLEINVVLIFLLYLFKNVSSYWFFSYRTAIVKADQKEYILNLVNCSVTVCSSIFQIAILVSFKNYIAYTVSAVALEIISNFISAAIATHMYPEVFQKDKDTISIKEIKDILLDCGALFVYKVNYVVLKATDNLVLSSFIGLSIVGIYSNYLLFYSTINTFVLKIYSATKASLGNLYSTADIKTKYFFFETMNFLTIILYGTACIGIATVSNELITCWIGDEYVLQQPLPILIGVELLFSGLKSNLGQVRTISGIFRQMWFRPVLGIIINLSVSIGLVKILGIYGVILGTIISDVLTNFLVDPSVIHKYSFKNYKPVSEYYRKNVAYLALLTFVGAVDMVLCRYLVFGHGWFSVIFHIIICGVSVPCVFIPIYWKKAETQYLWRKGTEFLKR